MKCRIGFVSNSSSSSFVVIGNVGDTSWLLKSEIIDCNITLGNEGEVEFGWGPNVITDMFSRINFAFIQADIREDWRDMLENVIKHELECDSITWVVNDRYAYIDHQSSSSEGSNTEIFDNEDTLRRFLFCEDSSIHLDNDNH
jgi:hypothetical protein